MKHENLEKATKICKQIDVYLEQIEKLKSEYINVWIYSNEYQIPSEFVAQTGENESVYNQELTPITSTYIKEVRQFIENRIKELENDLSEL